MLQPRSRSCTSEAMITMKYYAIVLMLCNLCLMRSALCADEFENVKFHGTLVAEPCVVLPDSENISINFGNIVDKYLYTNKRTGGERFDIVLSECDISIANTVKIIFTGNENNNLPGFLAIDDDMGVAVGIESLEGKLLPVNQPGSEIMLTNGMNRLQMRAYIQGEAEALQNRTIKLGVFNTIATFNFIYE
jgi:P pilus assembly protein, pilin FimA